MSLTVCPGMKTRTYLVLMATAILIPVVFFSLFGVDMLLQRERESRLRAVHETARATALAIDQEVAQAQGALRVFANTRLFERQDLGALYNLMRQGQASPNSWNIVYDDQGQQVLNTVVPYGAPLPVSRYGLSAQIIDRQKPHVSNLRLGELKKVAGISVDMPVPASSGTRHVVSQVFLADHLSQLLSSRGIAPNWVVGLFGSDGISIARNSNAKGLIGKPVRPELYSASLKSFSGQTRHVTRENIAVYSVYTHTARTGWTVAIGVPEAEIEEPARRAAWYGAVGIGLTFALAAGIALLMARRLTQALGEAVDAAHILGQGGTHEALASGVMEIDVLQSALHEASNALARENASRLALEAEREALLQSEQQARKEAEEQNKAKDEFLAMLGHELRNPLAPISTAAQILKASGTDENRVRMCSEVIDRQVRHMTELVNDLLDVSRVTRGLVALDLQDSDLGLIIGNAIEQSRPLIDARGHTLATDLAALPARVHGDQVRLVQVLVNLLNNAAKYTPEGGCIALSVQVSSTQVSVRVRDNGIGIEPALLPRVFDLFSQAERTPDRSQGGLGLGLALARSIMALHGGQITAASDGPGQGSTFTITLALASSAPA